MTRIIAGLLALFVLVFFSISCVNPLISEGERLFREAQSLEKSANYFQAAELYKTARAEFLKEGKAEKADLCRFGFQRVEKILISYPHTEATVRKMIKEKYKNTSAARIDSVIRDGRLDHILIAGQSYYFESFLNTLYHTYPEFLSQEESALGKSAKLFDAMERFIYGKPSRRPWETNLNPEAYLMEGKVSIPRKDLPAKGLFKVWVPLPIVTASQRNVEIISLYPEKYLKYPVRIDGDLGVAYLEIPLEDLKADLKIGLKVRFTRYEERFRVDPKKVGDYDRTGTLYKQYTASDKNIAVTPDIRRTARKIAGCETNPYLLARKFFDYVVEKTDYSFMPHLAIETMGIPESVYVHQHRYGDCGAQSMYFAALCRAVGIPARVPGGLQLFPLSKAGCGDHFWAEFYLPNYGWLPVDTSAAQISKYMPRLSAAKKQDFKNYFFAKMDTYRFQIQNNVDIPLIPEPEEPLAFSMVLQSPTAICKEMDKNPGLILMDAWKWNVVRLPQK